MATPEEPPESKIDTNNAAPIQQAATRAWAAQVSSTALAQTVARILAPSVAIERLWLHKCSKSAVCQHSKPAIMEPIISSSNTADARRSSRNAIYPKKFSPAPLVYAAAALLRFSGQYDIGRE